MTIPELHAWLSAAPVFANSPLNFHYLPSRGGWSMSVPDEKVTLDILGHPYSVFRFQVSRRLAAMDGDDRLATVAELIDLSDWALRHPPEGFRVRTGSPEFLARNTSGTEDLTIAITLTEL